MQSGARSKEPRAAARRLLRQLRPERLPLLLALVMGITAVGLAVLGPRLLGDATNVLFDGVVGRQLPAGVSKAQAVARLRAEGHGQLAQMVAHMHVTPGAGIDVDRLGRWLGLAAIVYLLAAAVGTTVAAIVFRAASSNAFVSSSIAAAATGDVAATGENPELHAARRTSHEPTGQARPSSIADSSPARNGHMARPPADS